MKKMIQDRYESNQRNSVKSIITEVTLAVADSFLESVSITSERNPTWTGYFFVKLTTISVVYSTLERTEFEGLENTVKPLKLWNFYKMQAANKSF